MVYGGSLRPSLWSGKRDTARSGHRTAVHAHTTPNVLGLESLDLRGLLEGGARPLPADLGFTDPGLHRFGRTNPNATHRIGKKLSKLRSVTSSFNVTVPSSGAYTTAYGIWDPNNRYEIMLWMNKTGAVGPLGSSQRTAPVGGSTSTVSDSEPYRVLGSARTGQGARSHGGSTVTCALRACLFRASGGWCGCAGSGRSRWCVLPPSSAGVAVRWWRRGRGRSGRTAPSAGGRRARCG